MSNEIIKTMREAIKSANLKEVKELVNKDKEILNLDTAFGSWLHVAAAHDMYEIVEFFIECGMDVNKNGGISGGNPIQSAARNGNLEVVKLLYNSGSNLDVSEARKNPLFGAICNGHLDVVKYLVEQGIDITASYSLGELDNVDAYEYARQYGQTEIASYFKEKLEEIHT